MPLVIPTATSYERALLYLSLPSLTTPIAEQHHEFIRTVVFLTSSFLTIVVNAPDAQHYAHAPAIIWDELQLLLGSLYVAATGAAFENELPLLDINVLVDGLSNYDILDKNEKLYNVAFALKNDEPYLKTRLPPTLALQTFDVPSPNLSSASSLKDLSAAPTYPNVAVGGTFDHLHSGHKILLTMSAFLPTEGGRLTCGVTSSSMLRDKQHYEEIESLEARMDGVQKFLDIVRKGVRYEIVEIEDGWGPTVIDPNFQALVVSSETEKGGVSVNNTRKERNMSPLELKIIDVISQNNSRLRGDGDIKTLKISSTWIREYLAKQKQK